jgi:predicted extracellular nuclease
MAAVVINEFAVAGTTAGDEFVELKNTTGQEIDLTGWRLVYRSAAGTTDVAVFTFAAGTKIAPGGYLLIANSSGYTGARAADFTYTSANGLFSGTAGGLALRNGAANTGTVIDSVGYGTATNAFVEGTAAPAPSASQSLQRNAGVDSNNNSNDFSAGTKNPQSSADNPPAAPNLTIDDVTHTEGQAGTVTYTFTVSLSAASTSAVTFDIATANGTGTTTDGDYVGKILTSQSIPAGVTSYTFDVIVNSDTAIENDEAFLVNVSNVTGATVTDGQGQGTIINDDFPPTPAASVSDATIVEGQSGVTYLSFTVSLNIAAPGALSIDYSTANGTATAGLDYLAVSGTVSFAAGEQSKTILVPVVGDTNAEANETLTVNLSNPTGATLSDGQGIGTITNDDASAYFALASGNFGPETWTDTSRITANDNWSGVPYIIGYLGDIDPAGAVTGVDARTLTGPNIGAVDVIANQTNPNTQTSGGVAEFEIANPTIALQGSGTADAPSIVLYLDASGRQDIHLTATLRDIDGSADDAAQQVNVQYRTDPNGTWTNVVGGYFADVTTGGSATQETLLDVVLPAGANNAPSLQVRIMTTNAGGSDEWVGIDNIAVSSSQGPAAYSISDSAVFEGTGGTTPISFTVTRAGDTSAAGTVDYTVTLPGGGFSANAADLSSALSGTVSFNAGETSKVLTLQIVADSNPEADEGFTVTLSNASSGGTLGDPSAVGTIVNDDGSPPFVSISDISQVEGNSGSSTFTFTITRTGGTGAFTLDYSTADGTATTANGDYVSTSGTLSFAAGENSKQVSVTVNGDTAGEFNETFTLNLSNPTGFAVLADSSGTGRIVNDDPIPIFAIQGSGATSPFAGQALRTQGIVTAIDSNGYYIQDPIGDGNSATSDGVFVFTGTAPAGVAIGDLVEVSGTVTEFVGGTGALSVTEINTSTAPLVLSTGNALPAAVIIGTNGVLPPTENGPGNGFGNALAFYESMEGMRVTVQAPLVVQDTNSFGETWVLASGGAGATGVNDRGGITISPGDLNPERIQIDNDANLSPGYNPTHTAGDILGDVTGIMNYANSSYEVLVTGIVTTTTDVTLPQETTTLDGDSSHLTIASYNIENADVGDGQQKFNILAGNIVYNLLAPDIIALQEIQDADGPGNGTDLSGTVTAQALIDAIKAIGGPDYVYLEIAPTTAGSTGGEPGGNIRNGFLYDPSRVSFVQGSLALINDSAFSGSRKPLVASFTFNGETVQVIDVHFTSRLGSGELEGATQPPVDAGDSSRTAQGQAVRDFINNELATDPKLKIGVFGDFNGFYFEGAVGALEAGGVMTDLHRLLPPEERYSYVFDGNSQAIDQAVVTQNLLSGAQFGPVHLNSEYLSNPTRPTDHDPIVGSFLIAPANSVPRLDLDASASGTGFASAYTEGAAPAGLNDTDITITDADAGDDIVSATITITNAVTGDILNVGTLPAGINKDPSSTATTVILVAAPGMSADNFKLAISAVTFSNSGNDPTNHGANLTRSITVVVNDGVANSNVATASVTVADDNADAPAGTSSTITAVEDTLRLLSVADFGFSDSDGTFASVKISNVTGGNVYYDADGSGPGAPAVTLMPATFTVQDLIDGKVSFKADANAYGSTEGTISFAVIDDDGNVAVPGSLLSVDVTPVDDAPVAQPDAVTTKENAVGTGNVFNNNGSGADNDIDGPALSVSAVNGSAANVGQQITLASGAKLTLNSDGTYSYDPNGQFNALTDPASGAVNNSATDTFTYTLTGGNTVTVTMTVTGVESTDDVYYGNGADNTITGTDGNNVFIVNQGGNDTIIAKGGNDYIYHGDTLTAADSNNGGAGTDVIGLIGNYELTLGVNSLVGIERLAMYSGSLIGGPHVNYSITTVDANVAAGERLSVMGNTLLSDEKLVFNGSAETDGSFFILAGAADDILVGGEQKDDIFGAGGADQLFGRGGNDYLVGGMGADMLRGGNGADVFHYDNVAESTSASMDHIVDFQRTLDHIDLSAIDANTNTAQDDAFTFIGAGAFSGTAGELHVITDVVNGGYFVEGDVDGDGNADIVIHVDLVSTPPLTAVDFYL